MNEKQGELEFFGMKIWCARLREQRKLKMETRFVEAQIRPERQLCTRQPRVLCDCSAFKELRSNVRCGMVGP